MSIPIFASDVSSIVAGQFISVRLTSPSAGVGHSSHPQNYKEPARVVLRNESTGSFQMFFDGSGYTSFIPSTSTTVNVCSPADNEMRVYCVIAPTLTTGSGQTNLLSCTYYFPGEPLPHPMGK